MRISNLFFSSFLHFLATFNVMPIYLVTLKSLGNLHLTIGVAARQGTCHMFDIARFLRICSSVDDEIWSTKGSCHEESLWTLTGVYVQMADGRESACALLFLKNLSETYILNCITLYISCFLNYLFFQAKIIALGENGRIFSSIKSVKNRDHHDIWVIVEIKIWNCLD